MSSVDAKELKGGHPPAVKAGGMRIATKSHPQHHATVEQKEEDKKFMEEEQIKGDFIEKPPGKVLVSGAEVKVHDPAKADSVKHFHEKHRPTVEKVPMQHGNQNFQIQQPRKQ